MSYESALAEKMAERQRRYEEKESRRRKKFEEALETTAIDWQASSEQVPDFNTAKRRALSAASRELREEMAAAEARRR